MNIIKAVNLVFDYIRRDEEGQVEEVKRALDHVSRKMRFLFHSMMKRVKHMLLCSLNFNEMEATDM